MVSHHSKLAIDGGTPLRAAPMPFRRAIGVNERAMLLEALDHYNQRGLDPGYEGIFEQRYCKAFADLMDGGYADALATGTAALFVAVAALALPAGSEVLVSPITDPGSISAIIMNGLVPRLVDTAPDSYNVGLAQVEARISSGTSCIMIVHSIGRPVTEIGEIVRLARARGIKVIEDCSQSQGATVRSARVGSFGDIAAFSTMYRKASITGASGGVIYTPDLELFRLAIAHADRGKPSWIEGFDDRNPSTFLFPALNLHTDELSCAIGLASLARLDDTRRRRLAFVAKVTRLLSEQCRACRPYGYSNDDSPFIYPVIVDPERIVVTKEAFARAVLAEGIGLNPHYNYLVEDWPWAQRFLSDRFETSNARSIRDRSFNLYLNENYGLTEAEDIVAAILKVESAYAA
jgi:dTDP-4-amino-4,6-dideoxygalactose transaminase